jgi:hypothetical protein
MISYENDGTRRTIDVLPEDCQLESKHSFSCLVLTDSYSLLAFTAVMILSFELTSIIRQLIEKFWKKTSRKES